MCRRRIEQTAFVSSRFVVAFDSESQKTIFVASSIVSIKQFPIFRVAPESVPLQIISRIRVFSSFECALLPQKEKSSPKLFKNKVFEKTTRDFEDDRWLHLQQQQQQLNGVFQHSCGSCCLLEKASRKTLPSGFAFRAVSRGDEKKWDFRTPHVSLDHPDIAISVYAIHTNIYAYGLVLLFPNTVLFCLCASRPILRVSCLLALHACVSLTVRCLVSIIFKVS